MKVELRVILNMSVEGESIAGPADAEEFLRSILQVQLPGCDYSTQNAETGETKPVKIAVPGFLAIVQKEKRGFDGHTG